MKNGYVYFHSNRTAYTQSRFVNDEFVISLFMGYYSLFIIEYVWDMNDWLRKAIVISLCVNMSLGLYNFVGYFLLAKRSRYLGETGCVRSISSCFYPSLPEPTCKARSLMETIPHWEYFGVRNIKIAYCFVIYRTLCLLGIF